MVFGEKRIVHNYQRILSMLSQYTRGEQNPQLVMVTKNQPIELVLQLIKHLNYPIIGENRVQEALNKIEACGETEAQWHFIGHLQRNKVKKILGKISLIHSLDRFAIAKEIEKQASRRNITVECLLQIDICQDGSKFGIYPSEDAIKEFLDKINPFSHLKIKGLMTIAPYIPPEETRIYFKQLRSLYEKIRKEEALFSNVEMKTLSMGMSNDYIIALEEGSTMIRLGTAIFGESD